MAATLGRLTRLPVRWVRKGHPDPPVRKGLPERKALWAHKELPERKALWAHKGATGAQGAMGAQGATGAQGAQGPQGNPAIGGYGLYAARPAAGNVGARYVTSDGGIEWVDDGSVWRPLIGGTAGGQVPLVAAFTNYGGTSTKTDSAGALIIQAGAIGELTGLLENMPGGAWTLTAFAKVLGADTGAVGAGIAISNGTKVYGAFLYTNGDATYVDFQTWTNASTYSADFGTIQNPAVTNAWLRITCDGAHNYSFYASVDGLTWVLGGTISDAGPTKVGPILSAGSGLAGVVASYQSYSF